MSETAANQLKRLLTLIPRLADGEDHPVADIATIVGITPEQLIEDLTSLVDRFDTPGGFVDGVQIYHEGGSVSVVTPHFLRPMRLTMSELCALELGLAIVRTERGPDEVAAVDRALDRLRSVISNVPGDEGREGLLAGTAAAPGVTPAHLGALRGAIRDRRKSRILYRRGSAPETEARVICPYSLVLASGMWYVVAHCEKAAALRVFRLDRIGDVTVGDDEYDLPPDFSVDRVLETARAFMPGQASEALRVRYSPAIAKWIAEREGVPLDSDGSVTVEHPLMDDAWAVRHVLQYGADAEVLSPPRLRRALRLALTGKKGVGNERLAGTGISGQP
jgi:proteasome accessory factor C